MAAGWGAGSVLVEEGMSRAEAETPTLMAAEGRGEQEAGSRPPTVAAAQCPCSDLMTAEARGNWPASRALAWVATSASVGSAPELISKPAALHTQ